jgi:hypothetical protein
MNKKIIISLLVVTGWSVAVESGPLVLTGNVDGADGLHVVTDDPDALVRILDELRKNPVALEIIRQELYEERKAIKKNNKLWRRVWRSFLNNGKKAPAGVAVEVLEDSRLENTEQGIVERGSCSRYSPRGIRSTQGSLTNLISAESGSSFIPLVPDVISVASVSTQVSESLLSSNLGRLEPLLEGPPIIIKSEGVVSPQVFPSNTSNEEIV